MALQSGFTRRRSAVALLLLGALLLGALMLVGPRESERRPSPPRPDEQAAAPAARIGESDARAAAWQAVRGASPAGCDPDRIQRALDALAAVTGAEDIATLAAEDDWRRRAASTLAASADAAHLHAAAWLTDDAVTRLGLLTTALAVDPDDAFLSFSAVRACRSAGASADCPLAEWETRLIELDRDNSVAWGEIAATRYLDGDFDGARRALQQGAAAARTELYWIDMVELIERGLAAGSDFDFGTRARAAFGYAASHGGASYGVLNAMCKLESDDALDWAYPCLAYAETFIEGTKTQLARMIMFEIQVRALELVGDGNAVAAAERRREAAGAAFQAAIDAADPLAERLLFSDPRFFARYLATIKAGGEIAALAYANDEARRWREDRTLAACEE